MLLNAQYVKNEAYKAELRRMRASDPEGVTSGIWNLILNLEFPVTDNYVHRPQYGTTGNFTDMTTMQWIKRPGHENFVQCKFLITQCKRNARSTQDSAWREGEEQIRRYLGRLVHTDSYKHRRWGIVAIGRLVKFYRWDFRAKDIQIMGTRNDPYDIESEATIIRRKLKEIRDKHR